MNLKLSMPSPSSLSVRPELQEPSYRKYESIFAAAITSFPSPVQFPCTNTGLKPVTAISRLRDVIRSFQLFEWPSDWWTIEQRNLVQQRALQLKVYPHPTIPDVVVMGCAPKPQFDFEVSAMELNGPIRLKEDTRQPVGTSLTLKLSALADDVLFSLQQACTCYCHLLLLGVFPIPSSLRIINDTTIPYPQELLTDYLRPVAVNYGLLLNIEGDDFILR